VNTVHPTHQTLFLPQAVGSGGNQTEAEKFYFKELNSSAVMKN